MLLPNWPTRTLGGDVWWLTIDAKAGWKIQKNFVTGHYRLLDGCNVRHAWSFSEKTIRLAYIYAPTFKPEKM
ncbi:hypothetical protein [Salimicrobium flavidum]|uniref:Uncharacterized protein n=1 Tax=Salimicrobium flavidum TaxID=570947 RepID=A0A1N7IWW4_9BACI|nr:hypothetical protein [Salimicrobium flavidum]SIS41481.1 hypothetical protein SAMN05421687_102369 [Salimicrobium flavidum]